MSTTTARKPATRRTRTPKETASARPAPAAPWDYCLPGANCTETKPPPGGEKLGAWFDVKAATIAEKFFPAYLRHTEGEWAGKPFHLRDDQRATVRLLFGWKRADGTRLFRVLWYEVPRKNGKTEFAAGLALLLFIADGEPGGQVYSVAVDKEQAKIVFDKSGVMVNYSPQLAADIEVFKNSIFCSALMAKFVPLSSRPGSKHGFSPHGCIGDEVHEWPDGELFEVVREGMGARRQPLSALTTTAGQRGKGFAWETHEYAVQVRDGTVEDPTMLVVIFAVDEERDRDDPDYWRTEEAWREANPGLGISPKLEFLQDMAAKASRSPRLENRFKRFYLNLWTEQAVRWLRLSDWDACRGDIHWKELEDHLAGRPCFAGLDLSTKIDLSSCSLFFPPEDPGGLWHALWRFYVPELRIPDRVADDRVPYDHWRDQGALIATPGNVIDYGFIEEQLRLDAKKFEIVECAFDPWNATQLATRMGAEGMEMVEFRQGYGSMSEPCKNFEAVVIDHRLRHGGHPVARWNAGNVAIRSDPADNIKPAKDESAERIDGIVAAIMGFGRGSVHLGDHESVYETRGLLVF